MVWSPDKIVQFPLTSCHFLQHDRLVYSVRLDLMLNSHNSSVDMSYSQLCALLEIQISPVFIQLQHQIEAKLVAL